jgi:hypothetical protein
VGVAANKMSTESMTDDVPGPVMVSMAPPPTPILVPAGNVDLSGWKPEIPRHGNLALYAPAVKVAFPPQPALVALSVPEPLSDPEPPPGPESLPAAAGEPDGVDFELEQATIVSGVMATRIESVDFMRRFLLGIGASTEAPRGTSLQGGVTLHTRPPDEAAK